MPFADIPRRMKIKFIYFVVLWLNAFPVKTGISSCFLPRELLVQWKLDYKKHCCVLPGSYCKVHDKLSPSITMVPRTHKAIALGPTGNLQGEHEVLLPQDRASTETSGVHAAADARSNY
jgi:hypothetical protein